MDTTITRQEDRPEPQPKAAAGRELRPCKVYLIMIGEGDGAYACTSFYSHRAALDYVKRQRAGGSACKYAIDALNVADGDALGVP